MRTFQRILVLLLLTQLISGCDSPTPVAPSPPPPSQGSTPVPSPAPPPDVLRVHVAGAVSDTAFRPVPGARVEVVDGPEAGISTITDAAGAFALAGRFDDTTLFRATKDDYLSVTKAFAPCCPTSRALYFFLGIAAAPVRLAGDYTLTFAADAACAGLPEEARTRDYNVTLVESSSPVIAPSSWFTVTFRDAPLLSNYSSFLIGRAGEYLAFNLEESEGPYLVEEIAPNAYVAIGGMAATTVGSAPNTISAAFEGTIEYCRLRSPMGTYYDCAANVARSRCGSRNHRVTLTRQS
jgi:hypothetical protein